MAEQLQQNNINIQQIVVAVISNLNALPSSTTASSNNPSTVRFESSQDELEAAFPRIARNAEDHNINSGASTSSTSNSTSIGGTPIRNLSARYSRYHNYSQGETSSRPRKGKEQQRSSTTGCFEKSGSKRGKGPGKKPLPKPTFKDVCLLPSPDYDTVPRMRSKVELISQGLYIDTCTIGALFSEHLITDQGDEIG